ncbi:zinc finger protein 512B [Carassius gibelio]|uniref:zinc finger protein 512B n=1 Tax=Carassius gibelio TaxID=101364 RepID=UPI0022781EF3|nr:zinc finger protein 512B [Carassius gibelio]XP_052396736.1 zinc finger protein 512B [Carassius gibelio]
MDTSSGARVVKPSSGLSKGRTAKQAHPAETARMCSTENNNHGSSYNEKSEGKKKGRPRVEVQELRIIPAHMMVQWKEEFKSRSRVKCPCSGCWLEFPSIYGLKYHYQRCQGATIAEKLSHSCPYCEAVFATKVRLQKHKLWNHPERVPMENKSGVTSDTKSDPNSEPKQQKSPAKGNAKKRPMENSPPSPTIFKVKKTQEVSRPSQNGECAPLRLDRRQQQGTSVDTGGSESEGGSLPPPFPEEDPERMKHRRKQKTPKKFTGEQPSISGTFGLKGMNKVEEKLKAGRMKRAEGALFTEESQKKQSGQAPSRKETAAIISVPPAEAQWQNTISERGEVVCPTCSVVTRKTVHGLKKHMEICQKLRDALKCQQCQKQFRSKAGLNYHSMADHIKPSVSENVSEEEQEERERLRCILKQMGQIKCTSEGCSAHFSSLMSYQYHRKRCGRELPDRHKPVFLCQHCGKTYRSKAGRDYHLRTEHRVTALSTHSLTAEYWKQEDSRDEDVLEEDEEEEEEKEEQEEPVQKKGIEKSKERVDEPVEKMEERKEEKTEMEELLDLERTPSGRVRRRSAQVAVFHLQEIAEDELAKDWGTKRRIKDDLVPDIKRLNYTRPGLPNFSPETVNSWKNEVKEKGFICCPNCTCEAIYSSVSGLKAHLASCNKGGGDVGKYTCLLCKKEFNSESGVKYHISKTHSQNWFRASTNEVTNNKKKEPESNGLQKDMKNKVPGKRRGRKPKEHHLVTAPFPAETQSFSPAPAPFPPRTVSPAPESQTPTPNPITNTTTTPPAPVDSGNPAQARDTQPPRKKRSKTKKASATE